MSRTDLLESGRQGRPLTSPVVGGRGRCLAFNQINNSRTFRPFLFSNLWSILDYMNESCHPASKTELTWDLRFGTVVDYIGKHDHSRLFWLLFLNVSQWYLKHNKTKHRSKWHFLCTALSMAGVYEVLVMPGLHPSFCSLSVYHI